MRFTRNFPRARVPKRFAVHKPKLQTSNFRRFYKIQLQGPLSVFSDFSDYCVGLVVVPGVRCTQGGICSLMREAAQSNYYRAYRKWSPKSRVGAARFIRQSYAEELISSVNWINIRDEEPSNRLSAWGSRSAPWTVEFLIADASLYKIDDFPGRKSGLQWSRNDYLESSISTSKWCLPHRNC